MIMQAAFCRGQLQSRIEMLQARLEIGDVPLPPENALQSPGAGLQRS